MVKIGKNGPKGKERGRSLKQMAHKKVVIESEAGSRQLSSIETEVLEQANSLVNVPSSLSFPIQMAEEAGLIMPPPSL